MVFRLDCTWDSGGLSGCLVAWLPVALRFSYDSFGLNYGANAVQYEYRLYRALYVVDSVAPWLGKYVFVTR
jgi:hypothetical protein